MINILKKWIIKIFSDIHNSLISIIVVIFLGGIGLSLSREDVRHYIYKILQISIPLWIGILVVLIFSIILVWVVIYKRNRDSKPPYKIKYFDVRDYKWEVKVYKHKYYEIDRTPICKTHDLKMVPYGFGSLWCCPEIRNENEFNKCNKKLHQGKMDQLFIEVNSYVDKIVRESPDTLFQRISLFFNKSKQS